MTRDAEIRKETIAQIATFVECLRVHVDPNPYSTCEDGCGHFNYVAGKIRETFEIDDRDEYLRADALIAGLGSRILTASHEWRLTLDQVSKESGISRTTLALLVNEIEPGGGRREKTIRSALRWLGLRGRNHPPLKDSR